MAIQRKQSHRSFNSISSTLAKVSTLPTVKAMRGCFERYLSLTIADWLDNNIVYDHEAKTNIGVAKRDKDSNSPCWYLDTEKGCMPTIKNTLIAAKLML